MRSYSRFLVELADTIVNSMANREMARSPGDNSGMARLYTVAGPFYRIAYQLDMFLFMGADFT
jgi:hypothetical protein